MAAVMTMLWSVQRCLLAEVLTIKDLTSGSVSAERAGHSTLTWVVAILLTLAICGIGFKKSKRTHLD